MDKEQVTRNRILEHAMQQFAVIGYSNISTAQLAADLKMSKSTLYKYYPSKESLLFAVIDAFYQSFEEEIQRIINNDQLRFTEKVQMFLLSVRKRFSGLAPSVVEDVRRAVPEAYERLEEGRKHIITETLIGIFKQGAKDGLIRLDISPVIIVNVLIQAQQYLEDPAVISSLSYNFTDMFQKVFSIIMEGCLSDQGRELFHQLN